MARKRIGELLLEAGLITKEQLEIALKEQKKLVSCLDLFYTPWGLYP